MKIERKETTMNIPRYIAACMVLFLFIYGYETLVHGVLLATLYGQTPTIWRDYDHMLAYVPFNVAIMILITLWLTFIFSRLFKTSGWRNGLRFGFYFGVLSGIQAAGAYYYLPISVTLSICWFIANVVEGLVGGVIIGLIYRH